jgi:hypothetical protein
MLKTDAPMRPACRTLSSVAGRDLAMSPGRETATSRPTWRAVRGRRVHSISNFLSLLAVRVARDERQEIVQRHGEITPGAALCIAVSVPP